MTTRLRGDEARVTNLELFFDLVFVLALTQCTALMAHRPTWSGLAQALLILGMLWWSWVGYAWLTSVVDPDDDVVRVSIFVAMAAFLIAALCVPEAFSSTAFVFAGAYAVVRLAHISLFLNASADDPMLHKSVTGLAISTFIGCALLVAAGLANGTLQGLLWLAALLLDAGGPFLFGSEGWKLVPGHFAERHALIVIIALGESIVAIGVGAGTTIDVGVVTAAVLGVLTAAALWWMYFDVVVLVARRRLENAAPGRERNEIARDSFSYLHFPMVAGIVLVALGFKKTLAHVEDPLAIVPAVALLGGTALYTLAHVAFRWRNVHRFSTQRVIVAAICLALIPVAHQVAALIGLALLALLLTALVIYERVAFADLRARLMAQLAEH